MDDIIEEQGQELYNKLNSEYLIECGEKKIDEWNDLYLEYLESEWNRLYPKRDWDLKNVFELVKRDFQLKRPDFHGEDFRDAISRGVRFARAHLEGANFLGAHLDGADFSEVHLEKADCSEILFDVAHMKGEKFIKAHMVGADLLMAHLEGAIFMETHLEGATFEYAIMDGKTMFIENSIDKKNEFYGNCAFCDPHRSEYENKTGAEYPGDPVEKVV